MKFSSLSGDNIANPSAPPRRKTTINGCGIRGAINTPFFLAFGLSKGAFLGTEAASTLSILLTEGIAFHQLGFLNPAAIVQGLLIGGSVLVGSIFSKKIVLALPEKKFILLMELVMLLSGASILVMSI